MAVSFRPDKLIIRNFRGIENLEVSFPEAAPTIFIGSNNTCKSTILNAVALALKGGGFHQWSPEEYDFFHSVESRGCTDFSITLHFRPAMGAELPAVQAVGNPTFVHGVEVRGTTERSGRFAHRHVLIDEAGEAILLMPRTLLKGESKRLFGEQDFGPFRRYATLDDIRQHLPTVWLLRPDNISASLYKWATGPLQRLSKLLASRSSMNHGSSSIRDENERCRTPSFWLTNFFARLLPPSHFGRTISGPISKECFPIISADRLQSTCGPTFRPSRNG
jgi:putative ATP-dependent endonuclease of the OLD family